MKKEKRTIKHFYVLEHCKIINKITWKKNSICLTESAGDGGIPSETELKALLKSESTIIGPPLSVLHHAIVTESVDMHTKFMLQACSYSFSHIYKIFALFYPV